VLDPARALAINAGGGMLNPTVVLDGRVVGSWKRTLGRTTVRVSPATFAPLGREARKRTEQAALRYGRFLGLTPILD
jgi:hypothetical protein